MSEEMSERLPRKPEIVTQDSPSLVGPNQKVCMAATRFQFPSTAAILSASKCSLTVCADSSQSLSFSICIFNHPELESLLTKLLPTKNPKSKQTLPWKCSQGYHEDNGPEGGLIACFHWITLIALCFFLVLSWLVSLVGQQLLSKLRTAGSDKENVMRSVLKVISLFNVPHAFHLFLF